MTDHDYLLALAAQIVSAHVANNTISYADVPKLIHDVHRALADAARGPEPSNGKSPVSVKQSVFSDHLICLECGNSFSMLKRHLGTDHQLTPEQYRQKWGLPASYPDRGAGLRKGTLQIGETLWPGASPGEGSAEGNSTRGWLTLTRGGRQPSSPTSAAGQEPQAPIPGFCRPKIL